MGCDIHLYVERRDGGRWLSADIWETENGMTDVPYGKHFYDDRNYSLFAILADVRNRGGYRPIAQPRGLPRDVTREVARASDHHGSDGHSHSWFTAAEIMVFDWTQIVTMSGIVNAPEYHKWNRWARGQGDRPRSYSQGVWGANVRHVDEAEMRALLHHAGDNEDAIAALSSVHTQVEWTEPYYRGVATFLSETLPRLWRLGSPEDVRVVFWFDN